MAARRGRRAGRREAATPPFTMAYATWPRAMRDARLSGLEACVLLVLARHPRNAGGRRDVLSVSAARIAHELGAPESSVCRALSALCAKTFRTDDGSATPVLTRLDPHAHAGRRQRYRLNVPSAWAGDGERDESGAQERGETDMHERSQSGMQEHNESDVHKQDESDMCSKSELSVRPRLTWGP